MATSKMQTENPAVFNDRQLRAAHRILDQLDRAANRIDVQYSRVRKHDRKGYRGMLSIFVPRTGSDRPPEQLNEQCFPGVSYSLSQGGVGFIMLDNIEMAEVWVGVHLPNQAIRWMLGRVVRRRAIPEEEFLEYGVAFISNSARTKDNME